MQTNILKNLEAKYSSLNLPDIKEKVKKRVEEFKRFAKRKIRLQNPFYDNQKLLAKRLNYFKREDFVIESFMQDVDGFKEFAKLSSSFVDTKYWDDEIEKLEKKKIKLLKKGKKALAVDYDKNMQEHIKLSTKLLFQKWQKGLEEEYKKYEKNKQKELEEEFLKEIEKYLDKVQKMYDLTKDLGIGGGMLFDLENGNLSEQDIKELQKWIDYIKNNKKVKELCDIMGRLRSASKHKKQELVRVTKEITVTTKEITSKEEIVGLRLDNNLEYALPFELALMNDEETSIIFDKKYLEKSLLCFDSNAIFEIEKESIDKISQDELRDVEEDDKMGPIVLCVDTSGSMMGTPENIAKAITLYIASRAKEQKRDCFLINFSTTIETFDFSNKLGGSELIAFLKKSFHGGTDIYPALNYAIDKMNSKQYKKADLLVISDFLMGDVGKDLENKAKEIKKNKNRFFSIAVGNYKSNTISRFFDKEWVFNPAINDISELNSMLEEI